MEMASYGLGELVFGYGFASVLHMVNQAVE